jgi:hypothetical protein
MFVTTHAAIGAVVGGSLANPYLALILGFISHFLVDMIPHGDEHMLNGFKSGSKVKRAVAYVTIDAIFAVYAILLILSNAPERLHDSMKWGIIGSVLPDLVVGVFELTRVKYLRRFTAWHHRNHHHLIGKYRHGHDIPFKWGVGYQVVACVLLLKLAVI